MELPDEEKFKAFIHTHPDEMLEIAKKMRASTIAQWNLSVSSPNARMRKIEECEEKTMKECREAEKEILEERARKKELKKRKQ